MFINEFILYGFLFLFVCLLIGLWREYRVLLRDIDQMQTKASIQRNRVDKLEIENEFLTSRNRFLSQQNMASRPSLENDFEDDFIDENTRSTSVTHQDLMILADEITSIRKMLDKKIF